VNEQTCKNKINTERDGFSIFHESERSFRNWTRSVILFCFIRIVLPTFERWASRSTRHYLISVFRVKGFNFIHFTCFYECVANIERHFATNMFQTWKTSLTWVGNTYVTWFGFGGRSSAKIWIVRRSIKSGDYDGRCECNILAPDEKQWMWGSFI